MLKKAFINLRIGNGARASSPKLRRHTWNRSLAVSLVWAFQAGGIGFAQQNGDWKAEIADPIADGSPLEPEPKPEPIVFDVESSFTKRVHVVESPELPGMPAPEGIINVTVQRVKDPGLPDPPPPPPLPALPPDDPAVLARMAELRQTYRETQIVFVSATVYDHSRTYFRCYPSGGGGRKEIHGWSNLDFNHFSGFGTYRVEGADGDIRQYALLMGLGNEDTQQMATWMANFDREYQAPESPMLPDLETRGPAFVITGEDTADHEAKWLIEGMHNLYQAEGARMKEAYHARVEAFEARKAFLLANPPIPEDVTIQFWKRDVARRNTEIGGGR